jgi:hypothetical protein
LIAPVRWINGSALKDCTPDVRGFVTEGASVNTELHLASMFRTDDCNGEVSSPAPFRVADGEDCNRARLGGELKSL